MYPRTFVRWYDGIMNLLTIFQPIEAHFTAELYIDSVEILVEILSSVVQLYIRVTEEN